MIRKVAFEKKVNYSLHSDYYNDYNPTYRSVNDVSPTNRRLGNADRGFALRFRVCRDGRPVSEPAESVVRRFLRRSLRIRQTR